MHRRTPETLNSKNENTNPEVRNGVKTVTTLKDGMDFESCITALKAELSLKHPNVKTEGILNIVCDERELQLINKIQLIVTEITKSIASGNFPVFKSIRKNWGDCSFDERLKLKDFKGKLKRIDFKRRSSRAEFAVITFLLAKIHKLMITKRTCTRRELYYENVKMFKSQKQVDYGMREICCILNAPVWELRVLATSKGIVAGPVVFTLAGGELIDCDKQGGVSIPQNVLEIENMSSSASWVLIIEKDASFQKLTETRDRLESCILITGKGFPDVNSRILVCKFWQLLHIPILVLVDADPHGFEIMCVYRFGSLSMSSYSEDLACPAVRWLGVHPSDIRPLLLDYKILSLNDVRKVHSLLKRTYVEENVNLKAQLDILLEENVKAEIESVACISTNYLTDVYMRNKIQCKEYI